MATSPPITVGLPVYNSERYLRQSLDSLLGQTFSDFTLIISDNASTDGTERIAKEYAATDARIRYFRNPENIGNPRNFNRVYELTTTPYLKWSTSDDYWAPTFLERSLEVMERDPTIALCYPQAYLVDANAENAKPYEDCLHLMQEDPAARFESLLLNIALAHQHLGLIRMSCLRRTHLLGVHIASDINLLGELSLYGKFYELPERLFFRRFHKASGSWKRGDAAHEAAHYHSLSRQPRLQMWRAHAAFFRAVASSPLPVGSKMRLHAFLLRRMNWHRRGLLNEAIADASSVLQRRPSRYD